MPKQEEAYFESMARRAIERRQDIKRAQIAYLDASDKLPMSFENFLLRGDVANDDPGVQFYLLTAYLTYLERLTERAARGTPLHRTANP